MKLKGVNNIKYLNVSKGENYHKISETISDSADEFHILIIKKMNS